MDIRIEQKRRGCKAPSDTKLSYLINLQLNHNIHNLSCIVEVYCVWSLYYFVSKFEGVFNYEKLKMDKSSYKSAEKLFRKEKKQP